ncbi:MAG: DUF2017 family protein [Brachybacterium sp.]|nr:DUF2017 family protein [Brachybacterium sp.]
MAYEFVRRADGPIMCRLDAEEKAVIAQVAQEIAELVRTDLGLEQESEETQDAAESEDPLRRLEAEFASREARHPADSAVRRLFPDAASDPGQAEEYRRLAQGELADAKLEALHQVTCSLDGSGPGNSEVVLSRPEAERWLRALTDMRIVLADRLGVRRDGDFETLQMLQGLEVPEEAEPAPTQTDGTAGPDLVAAIYELLSWLQESLVAAMDPGPDDR